MRCWPSRNHPKRWWRRSSSSAGRKPADRAGSGAALNLATDILEAQRRIGSRPSLFGITPRPLPSPTDALSHDCTAAAPAPHCTSEFDTTWSLSGSSLIARAAEWAARLHDAGLRPGDAVALALSRGPELAPLHLAALAGAHPIVPLNTAMATPEVGAVLEAARPKLVVAAQSFLERHASLRDASPARWWIEERCAGGGDAGAVVDERTERRLDATPCSDGAPAIVLFTSGTTGAPKSVPLSHGNLRANLLALAELWQRSSEDRLLHVLPAHHFHGLVLGVYGSLLAANTVVMMPGFDAAATLAAIRALGINLLMGVPTVYARLLETDAPPDALAGLRLAISGSAPLPAALWAAFHRRYGVALINRYGLTETGIVASTHPRSPRAGTVGAPLPGTEVLVRTEDGRYLRGGTGAATARGELCVRGPSVTAGYGNAPYANAQSFRDGIFHTGDLGYFDEHGELWVEGRVKELIIVGGSNVIPGEVEAPLSQVEGVREVVVTGAAHRDLGEVVVAWVVAATADTKDLETRMRACADAALSAYKRPRSYFFVEAIPRNAMGKVDRKRLVAPPQ